MDFEWGRGMVWFFFFFSPPSISLGWGSSVVRGDDGHFRVSSAGSFQRQSWSWAAHTNPLDALSPPPVFPGVSTPQTLDPAAPRWFSGGRIRYGSIQLFPCGVGLESHEAAALCKRITFINPPQHPHLWPSSISLAGFGTAYPVFNNALWNFHLVMWHVTLEFRIYRIFGASVVSSNLIA